MKLKAMVDVLLKSIYPLDCLFCGAPIEPECFCCIKCEKAVQPRLSVGKITLSEAFTLPYCSLYPYDAPVKYAIHSMKFHDRKENGEVMGKLMAENEAICRLLWDADCITAVPISRKRKADRGYNQSELIARTLAEHCHLPYENLLEKHIDNEEQSSLTRNERLENVSGVYRKLRKKEVKGKNLVLVDDIITTGATLYECAAVLYAEGAKRISAVTFAHSKLS